MITMMVQTALLFGYVLPENTRADIEKMLKNIREKSPFEYDIAYIWKSMSFAACIYYKRDSNE